MLSGRSKPLGVLGDEQGDAVPGLSALLGGSLGAVLGMWLFRHKTRHWYFAWGLPLILLVQIAAGIWLSRALLAFCSASPG